MRVANARPALQQQYTLCLVAGAPDRLNFTIFGGP